jgi:hypothetical protein
MTDPAPSDRAETDRYWREVIVPHVAAARAEREHVLVGREDLVSRVEALLFYEDPIGINFDTNTDEYRPEAQTIVIRLPEATSPDDVQRVVHEEFVRWFDRQIAGPVERYRIVAESIWGLWTAGAGGSGPIPA